MDNEYESLQTKIDRLLWETSKHKSHKKYQEMSTSNEYKSAMKKIGKLVLRLEKLEEENKSNRRQNKRIYT